MDNNNKVVNKNIVSESVIFILNYYLASMIFITCLSIFYSEKVLFTFHLYYEKGITWWLFCCRVYFEYCNVVCVSPSLWSCSMCPGICVETFEKLLRDFSLGLGSQCWYRDVFIVMFYSLSVSDRHSDRRVWCHCSIHMIVQPFRRYTLMNQKQKRGSANFNLTLFETG